MPIVFDHVDGVIQRSPEAGAEEPDVTPAGKPVDPNKLAEQIEHLQRRRERLMAD